MNTCKSWGLFAGHPVLAVRVRPRPSLVNLGASGAPSADGLGIYVRGSSSDHGSD